MPTTPPPARPRTRALARRQALHDARILTRIRKADRAKLRAEAEAESRVTAGWTDVGTVSGSGMLDGAVVSVAPVGTPPPFLPAKPTPMAVDPMTGTLMPGKHA